MRPPWKGVPGTAQLAPQLTASDYDTDTNANLTDVNAASEQPPPPHTNAELNLTVLQRWNPQVKAIVSIAPFAVVYLFSPTTQQWEKCGIEGTLFTTQLLPTVESHERFGVIVLNRKGLENFESELFSGEDVEITEEYVILQVLGDEGEPNIYGLWIFSEPEPSSTAMAREINAQVIMDCAKRAQISREMGDVSGLGLDVAGETEFSAPVRQATQEEAQPPGQEAARLAMGRQLSLRELFGHQNGNAVSQNRGQDGAMGPVTQRPAQAPQSTDEAGTKILRSIQPIEMSTPQAQRPSTQQTTLLDLFNNAKPIYNGS